MNQFAAADTDNNQYHAALMRRLIVPVLPIDFRELPNEQMAYAFAQAEPILKRAVAALMRRIETLETAHV